MAKKSTKQRILKLDNDVWEEFGIFPNVLGDRADVGRMRSHAARKLDKLGEGNLRLLLQEFEIALPTEPDKSKISRALLESLPDDLLVHAFEFQKRRSAAINKTFLERFPKAKALAADVRHLGNNPREILDKTTKLLLLINQSESNLKDIFYLSSWESRDTTFRFSTDISETALCSRLIAELDDLTEMLSRCSDFGGERLGFHDLNGQALVIVHLRKFRPRVSRDYATTHNLHHVCGSLIIGVSHHDGYLHVKSPSKNVADTIEQFLQEKLELEVTRIEEQVVSDFDTNPLSDIIRGKMPNKSKFNLVGISLNRTSIGGVPLTIPRAAFNGEILQTLEALHESAVISADTPVVLDSLDFDFGEAQIKVSCQPVFGGALRLTYQNAGLSEELQHSFEGEFEKEFGVPLNRQLNPSAWSLGTTGIVAFVLHAKTKEEIQDYQKHVYDELVKNDIMEERVEKMLTCSRPGCSYSIANGSDIQADCKVCSASLKEESVTVVGMKENGLQKWIRKFIKKNTGWEMESRQLTFESQKYFPIQQSNQVSPEKLASLFQHRVSAVRQTTFDRASMPLIRFSDQNIDPPIRVERDEIATVSVPFLLRCIFEPSEEKDTGERLEVLFDRVRSTYDARVSRAARLSAERLETPPDDQDGDRYEVDLFNLLRWLFWYANRLGKKGEREPDGFLSLQDYRDTDEPTTLGRWNLGYDAKFRKKDGTYDFGPEQHRQAGEYIRKYFRAKTNKVKKDRRILGHAILSNSIEQSAIASFVEHLRSEKIVSATEASPVIALIQDTFLTTLYRELSKDESTFRRKRLHLHFLVIQLLESTTPHGFINLDERAARFVLESLGNMDVIEDGLTVADLTRESFADIPTELFTPTCPMPDPIAE